MYYQYLKETMMDPKIKKRWIKALRSGKYKQTKGVLHNEDGFCCLGVLCDLVKKELKLEWKLSETRSDVYDIPVYTICRGKCYHLPRKVADYAKLKQTDPSVSIDRHDVYSLANANDEGFTFNEIADIIEEKL